MNRRSFLTLFAFGLVVTPRLPAPSPPVIQESAAGWPLERAILEQYKFALVESMDRDLFADDMEGVIR